MQAAMIGDFKGKQPPPATGHGRCIECGRLIDLREPDAVCIIPWEGPVCYDCSSTAWPVYRPYGSHSGPVDEDSGGYQSIARRELEEGPRHCGL